MHVALDLRDPTPIYEQLVSSVKELINRAELRPGDALPTVRQLAQDLGVNLNTVARAYRELAKQGILSVRQGRGASVVSTRGHYGAAERENLQKKLKWLVNEALVLGVGERGLHAMVDSELHRLKEARG
ncbi:MAG: GntR family transcriptional regulator [Candidatus Latescibacteria bacterium]|nr:GntR family transcriptional regulator [Candidatus Latescibacterota bacterium]